MQDKCQAKYTIPDARKANTPIDIKKQKKILAEGEYCPPLSIDVLKKHDLETSCELRQFRCPECYVYWWKTVPKYKPVSTCFQCQLCLNPLEYQEQFGVGRFTCQCGNYFYSKCQGSDVRVCIKCGCTLHRPYIHPLFRKDDLQRIPITAKQGHPTRKASAALRDYLPGSYVPRARTHDNFAAPVYSNLPQPRRRPHRSQFGDFIPATFYHRGLHQPATSYPTAHISTIQALAYPAYGSVEGINPSIATNNAYPPKEVVPVGDSCGPSLQPITPPLSEGSIGVLEPVGSTIHATMSSCSDHADLQYSQTSNLQHLSNPRENLDPPLLTLSVDSPLQVQVNASTSTGDQPPALLSESSLPLVKSTPLHTAISALAIEVSSDTISSASAPQLASSSNCVPLRSPINFNIVQDEISSDKEKSSPIMSTTSLSSAKEPLSVANTPLVHAPEHTSPFNYDPSIPSNSTIDPLAISKPSLNQSPGLENGVPSGDKPVDFAEISAISRFYSPTSEMTAESSTAISSHTSPLQTTTNDSTQLNLHLSTDLSLLQAETSTPNSLSVSTDSSTDLGAFQTEGNTSVNLKTSKEFAQSRTLNSLQKSEPNTSISLNLDTSPQELPLATTYATSPQSETTSSAPQQLTQVSSVSLNSTTDSTSLHDPTVATGTDRTSVQKTRFFRDPRDLKYKQVSTRHDCSGLTESTIVPQLDDWPQISKFKQYHRAYRRPQMSTYNFDCTNDSSSSDEDV